MKLIKDQREQAKKFCLEYAQKHYSIGTIVECGLSRVSGSSLAVVRDILKCGAILVDFKGGLYKDFRLNPYLAGCFDAGQGEEPLKAIKEGYEPFWSKESYILGEFRGYVEEYDDTCETHNSGVRVVAEYLGHKIRIAVIEHEGRIQTNASISREYQNDLKLPPFFDKTKEEVLEECKKVIDNVEMSLLVAIQTGNKKAEQELMKKAEAGELIRII